MKGRSFIVTGGASGIGLATVHALATLGCNVTIADLQEQAGRRAAQDCGDLGDGSVQFIETDVADPASVARLVDAAEQAFGQLHGAVNAAAIPQAGRALHELSDDDWDRSINVNLRGAFLCIRQQIIAMRKYGAGSIVAISSTAGIKAIPRAAEYCSGKSGLLGLVRGAALDFAQDGIRVNAVLPGGTDTPMFHTAAGQDASLNGLMEVFPLKRLARPEEIAAAAVWLLSDAASYVTGAMLPVDGALSIV